MSIWTIMNGVAWALCALFAYLILSDLIKVEKAEREEKKNGEKTGIHGVASDKEEASDGPAK